jgi:hypothetical protein
MRPTWWCCGRAPMSGRLRLLLPPSSSSCGGRSGRRRAATGCWVGRGLSAGVGAGRRTRRRHGVQRGGTRRRRGCTRRLFGGPVGSRRSRPPRWRPTAALWWRCCSTCLLWCDRAVLGCAELGKRVTHAPLADFDRVERGDKVTPLEPEQPVGRRREAHRLRHQPTTRERMARSAAHAPHRSRHTHAHGCGEGEGEGEGEGGWRVHAHTCATCGCCDHSGESSLQ